MTHTKPYLAAAEAATSPTFAFRHRASDDGLHDIADSIRTELSHRGQWRPLIAALEQAVTSPAGMTYIRSFPHEDRVHAANQLAAIISVHAGQEIKRRLEVLASRR